MAWNNTHAELLPDNLKCIERAHELYPCAIINFITNLKALPFDYLNPLDWDQFEDEQADKYPRIKRMVTEVKSDFIRFEYLSNNPFTLWLDCDCYLRGKIPFEDKLCAASIFCIYNHDAKELKVMVKKCLETESTFGRLPQLGDNLLRHDIFVHREKNLRTYFANGTYFKPG